MRIAFYGRYSSDNQREASIEDQHRVVQRWAERYGHAIIGEFSDAAVSGASAKTREGLQAALDAAHSIPPAFEALVVDQLSRLSRDVGDTDTIIKRLKFAGVRVIAVSDGIDTGEETTKISVTVKSLVNELYLDDLRKTTKRGLDGQFLKGLSTGGRTYGYRSEPVFDESGKTDPRGQPIPVGYRLAIEPNEATTVRDIFSRFRDGEGEKAIAKKLNARTTGKVWRPNTIYLMLQNCKYRGLFYFNRREWRKHPETGRRVCRLRPSEQWEKREIEELRIIDQELWDAVQMRLASREKLFTHARQRTTHLLSGLLVCDQCSGRLGIAAKDYYACRNHVVLGTCENDLRIHRETIEEIIVREFAAHLPQYIELLRDAASQIMSNQSEDDRDTRAQMDALRKEAETIMGAIGQGRLQGRALDEALATYQRLWSRADTLESEQVGKKKQEQIEVTKYDPEAIKAFVNDLPAALRTDVRIGREFLNETLKSVRVAKIGNGRPNCPVCKKSFPKLTVQHLRKHRLTFQEAYRRYPEVGFTKRARLSIQPNPEGIAKTGKEYGFVVAGRGFEPLTFGL